MGKLFITTLLVGFCMLYSMYLTTMTDNILKGPMSPGLTPEADFSTKFELASDLPTMKRLALAIDLKSGNLGLSSLLQWSVTNALYAGLCIALLVQRLPRNCRGKFPFNRFGIKVSMLLVGNSIICAIFLRFLTEFLLELLLDEHSRSAASQAKAEAKTASAYVAFVRVKWTCSFMLAGYLSMAYQVVLAPWPKRILDIPKFIGSKDSIISTLYLFSAVLGVPSVLLSSFQLFLGFSADLLRAGHTCSLLYHSYTFLRKYSQNDRDRNQNVSKRKRKKK